MRRNIAFGTFLEGQRLRALGSTDSLARVPVVDGVHAVHNEPIGRVPLLAGILEGNPFKVTKAHLPGAAGHHKPENPSLRLTVADLQIKPVAVTI